MRTCAWALCTLLVLLSVSTSQPHSHLTGVTRTRKYLSKAYFCSADSECAPRLYCQAPGHAHSQCSPCRRRARRCPRDGVCCPGNECRHHVCSRVSAQHTPAQKNPIPRSPGLLKTHRKKPRKGELGAQCVRSADCGRGLCCARHLWKRVCKAEPQEGQVCSTPWRRKHTHTGRALELFQLCPCATGLECRTQSHTPTHTDIHTHTHTHTNTDTQRSTAAVRLHTCQQL